MTMLVFTFLFKQVAQIGWEPPFLRVFVLAGVLPWTFFSSGVQNSGTADRHSH